MIDQLPDVDITMAKNRGKDGQGWSSGISTGMKGTPYRVHCGNDGYSSTGLPAFGASCAMLVFPSPLSQRVEFSETAVEAYP